MGGHWLSRNNQSQSANDGGFRKKLHGRAAREQTAHPNTHSVIAQYWVLLRSMSRNFSLQKNITAVPNEEDFPANRLNKDAFFCHLTDMEPFVRGR
jgi:hypothetical protein